ncbi:MarR family winged helix-turn-helix transcriptional regulator [Variibacter gotjawalensis]|nr:MarR family transcriptional regulator [Variibacter gotjawalensis]NIK46675.1 DNA-binding MarR family transcriptional regulator [Variibacter gotjawalensis]
MDDALAAHDLNAPQYSVLEAIQNNPGATNADLAREALVTAQTMGGIVQALELANCVERVPGEARRISNRLTRTGADILRRARRDVQKLERDMVDGIDKSKLESFSKTLSAMTDKLRASESA